MANGGFEYTGKTVDEAIEEGLRTLGLSQDQVDIEVISKGSRGILGFGSEPARVRLTPQVEQSQPKKPATVAEPAESDVVTEAEDASPDTIEPTVSESSLSGDSQPAAATSTRADHTEEHEEEPEGEAEPESSPEDETELTEMATSLLAELIQRMGYQATVEATWQTQEENGGRFLNLDIQGDELGALIGRRGETLANIQYLLRLMVNQRLRQWKNIVVDVEQYRQRRTVQLTHLAERMAEQVIDTERAIALEPMSAAERRIVHLALRDHPDVYTESTGEGERRKVMIIPRQ